MMKIRDVRNIIMTIMPQEEEVSIIDTINHMFEKIIIHKINELLLLNSFRDNSLL
jgi:hypothetical protein